MSAEAIAAPALAAGGYETLLELDQGLLDALPVALYVCSADGVIRRFNRLATQLWMRTPTAGDTDELYCGSFRLYDISGKPLPHASTPMKAALRTGEPQKDREIVIGRPDGTRITVRVNIRPLIGPAGAVVGAITCFQDITAATRAEESLRAAETRNRAILDAIPAAIYTTDADGYVTYFNRAAAELAGREPELGKDRWCVSWRLHNADGSELPLDKCPMAVALKEGRPVRGVEALAHRPDGTLVPFLPYPTPLFDQAGVLIGGINMLVDVSERKRAEEALARRMTEQAALHRMTDRLYHGASLADALEAALDAITSALGCARASILLFDDQHVMRFAAWRGLSEAYRRAVEGHSPWTAGTRDAAPICVSSLDDADFEPQLRAAVEMENIGALAFIPLFSNGEVTGKFMTYYDKQHVFSTQENAVAVTIARHLGFTVQRIRAEEARRRAQEELRDSEQRLQMALEAGGMGAWEWDLSSGKVIWSPTLEAIHGLKPGMFGGSFENFRREIHPDDEAAVEAAIEAAVREHKPYHVTYRAVLPDRSLRWLEAFGRCVEDSDGSRKRLIGICMDITQRKEAEAQREILIAELSHRVKNALATVVSIARQSFSSEKEASQAYRSFEARIRALAQTHGRLAETRWSGVSLRTILEDELAPYRHEDGENVRLSGPSVSLPPKRALALGMAFHELATNAAKYGSFSVEDGRLEISWNLDGNQLRIDWKEQGGPEVAPPTKTGFGRLLLERVLADDLNGEVKTSYDRGGVRCSIKVLVGAASGAGDWRIQE